MDYDRRGITSSASYVKRYYSYFINYDYARSVILYYINSNSFNKRLFINSCSISYDIFNYCVDCIKELDVSLYNEYLNKKEDNDRLYLEYSISMIKSLAYGIRNGVFEDGTVFNVLEFIKRVPFKDEIYFLKTIKSFMNRYTPEEYNIIVKYIANNNLCHDNCYNYLDALDLKEVYSVEDVVNGILVSKDDKDYIIKYMKDNDIALTRRFYIIVRNMYLDGKLDFDVVKRKLC